MSCKLCWFFFFFFFHFAGISVDAVQINELQESLEAEQYFTTLYKSQIKELKEEIDEKSHNIEELENKQASLQEEVKTTEYIYWRIN